MVHIKKKSLKEKRRSSSSRSTHHSYQSWAPGKDRTISSPSEPSSTHQIRFLKKSVWYSTYYFMCTNYYNFIKICERYWQVNHILQLKKKKKSSLECTEIVTKRKSSILPMVMKRREDRAMPSVGTHSPLTRGQWKAPSPLFNSAASQASSYCD